MSLAGQTRRIVDETLTAFLDRAVGSLRSSRPSLVPIGEGLRELVLRGGKRLRPVVAVGGYVAAGGARPADAARLVSGLELLQAYLLVHDDWMDGDVTRRGGPTLHVRFGERWGRHVGDAAAVLAGDLSSAWARAILLDAPDGFAPEALLEAQRVYAAFEADVVQGQMLDLLGLEAGVAVEELEDLKTGSYTVRGPLRLGAALAGAGPALHEGLAVFGRPLGQAFQIRDDLLGLFGDPARTGKAVGQDLRAGKRTWLVDRVLGTASAAERAALEAVLGRADAPAPLVARVIALFAEGGVQAAAEARVAELCGEARVVLAKLDVTAEGREMLDELVGSLAQRAT
jgi:geranylgeranyl diphosphate synthase type I